MKFNPIKHRDFLLLLCGKFTSLFGTRLQSFALSLYVLDKTGSATSFASVAAISFLPSLFLGPIAGVIADWFDRKKIIVILDIISGLLIGLFAFILFTFKDLNLISIYALVLSLSIISSFFGPAASTVLPSIIKKEDLVQAHSIMSFTNRIPGFLAMLIGGIFYGFIGLLGIMIINSLSFLLSALSELFINIPKVTRKPSKITIGSFSKDFMEGISFIRSNSLVVSMLLLSLILNFVFAPIFGIGVPFILRSSFGISAEYYGVVQSISLVAMFIAPVISGTITKTDKIEGLVIKSLSINVLLLFFLSFFSSKLFYGSFDSFTIPIILIVVVCFSSTLLTGIVNIALTVTFQKLIPLEMMGRAGSLMGTICVAAVPLGQTIFGISFDIMPTWVSIVFGGIISMLTILYFCKTLNVNRDVSLVQK